MTQPDGAHEVLDRLRPQQYAVVPYHRVQNPIVEPMWAGIRALAAVQDGVALLRGEDGEPVDERPEVRAALATAVRTPSAVLDGWLTKEAIHSGVELLSTVEMPTVSMLIQKTFFGIRRDRQAEADAERRRLRDAQTFGDEEIVAFVATDLLWLDGDSLLDVPLLERKRLLGGVLEESELVRLGAFVRPPVDTWVTSWRRLGFVELSYRAANSRYHPGAQHEDWTTARMPRR